MSYQGNFTVVIDVKDADLNLLDGKLQVRFQDDAAYTVLGGEGLVVLDRFMPTYGRYPVAVDGGYALTLPTDVASGGVQADSLVGYDLTFETDAGTVVSAIFAAFPAGSVVDLSDLVASPTTPPDMNDAQAADPFFAANLDNPASDTYAALMRGWGDGEVVTHPRWGAKGDLVGTDAGDATNDFDAIQACINAVGARPDGGVVRLPPRRFLMDSTVSLSIPSNVTLKGSGRRSVLYFPYDNKNLGTVHTIANSDRTATGGNVNIELLDFTIEGPSPGGPLGVPSSPGVTVLFQYVDKVKVSGVRWYRTYGPAIHTQGCTEVQIVNNKIEDIGRGGIVVLGRSTRKLRNVLIAGNVIVGVGDDGIACPNTSPGTGGNAENVTIAGNTIDGVYVPGDVADGGRGILCLGVNNLVISGNAIGDVASRAIVVNEHEANLTRSTNVVITGNVGLRPGPIGSIQSPQGMYIAHTDYLTIGPHVIAESGGYGLYLDDCTHVSGGPLTFHHCGEVLSHGGLNIFGANTSDIDLWVNAYECAGPGVVVTDGTRIVLRGRAINNCNAGTGIGDGAAGILLKTAGEVTLDNFRVTDTRATKKQTYGVATTTAAPARLTIIGGDYSGNINDPGLRFVNTTPVQLIKRGVVESTDPSKNYDQDASGVRIAPPLWGNLTTDTAPVNNSTTLVDALSVTGLATGATYEVTGQLDYSVDAAADLSVGWKSATLPGSVMSWNLTALVTTVTTQTQGSVYRTRLGLASTATAGGIGAGSRLTATISGKLVVGNTAAPLTLQFAQAVAHASDTVLYAQGTYLKLVRIA